MTHANDIYETIMQELNNVVICDADETKERQEGFSFQEETDVDEIPASLLSYFKSSKSRAAACEKLILEEPEDIFVSHHTEDMTKFPTELDEDINKLNKQVLCDLETDESSTPTDTRPLHAPTETEELLIHHVSVCLHGEGEAETDEYEESEKHSAFGVRTLEISVDENESLRHSEYEAEWKKLRCEEEKEEERRRQIEDDFQKELKKIIEAEKLHQRELEMMERRAQEKLEQELLLQQEAISNLQRRVKEERRRVEEEQKRLRDEEEQKRLRDEEEQKRLRDEEEQKRKRDEEEQKRLRDEEEQKRKRDEEDKREREVEKEKIEAERRRMEEERMEKKEETKMKEIKLIKEEERKKAEEEKKRKEREKKREEERLLNLEKEKLRKMVKEKEERNKKEEEEKEWKRNEEKTKIEEARKVEREKGEKEQAKVWEEEERNKKEEKYFRLEKERIKIEEIEERGKKRIEEDVKMEAESERLEEKGKRKIIEGKKEEEEKPRKGEGENKEEDDRKTEREEERMRKEERNEKDLQEKKFKDEVRKRKEEKELQKREMEKIKEESERKNAEEASKMTENEKKVGVEKEKKEEHIVMIEEKKRKKGAERKTNGGENMAWHRSKEEMTNSKRLPEDQEGLKGHDEDEEKIETENKRTDKERELEEERKLEREKRENVEGKKEQVEEEVQGNKDTEEEIRHEEKENKRRGKMQEIMMKEERKIHEGLTNITSSIWTSPRPGPPHIRSAVNLISTETTPHHNTTQSSTCETVGCENQAGSPSSGSDFVPVFLPEHTELKRLTWMKECIPWTKLSLQNRRKQGATFPGGRGTRRASSLPPLCPDFLLQSTSWKSLKEVTTVNLEDLPGCSLSTLSQCTQLQRLTLRRCSLKSLEGIKQLPHLYYVDVQENEISSIDCENMASLRVLKLGHNKLTSIHGLTGAENLDVLELSHNSITRIAGLESMKRLQKLSLDHNQLISTKGLKDVFTLLHLNCSHNHLVKVEGVENSALLNTLDLRANSLTEPPSLNNQVLLRKLHLDDNSISSLQSLADCWLPLLQHLSAAQNRITQLHSMSDAVSLANIDLRFNCLSELQSVSESLKRCQFLRELHLTGNPLQQESGWRSSLQKALPGLRAIDDQETDSFSSPTAVSVQQVSSTSGSFLAFCQAQLQQTRDLQQQHSRELSKASSPLDAAKISCRHLTETLQLAVDQRFAHEYGDTSMGDKHKAAAPTTNEETLTMAETKSEEHTESMKTEITGNVSPVIPHSDRISSCWASQITEGDSGRKAFDAVPSGLRTRLAACRADPGGVIAAINPEVAPVSNHQILVLKNKAAVVIQQLWRKYKQKCGNMGSPSAAERRGEDKGGPESGPAFINRSVVGQDRAATVIQALWRGFTLRRRLASALAAVTCSDTGDDDTFEEVDVDEFVFDEAALEEHWTPLCEDPLSRKYTVLEQQQHTLPPPLTWRSKQAWVDEDQEDSGGQRVSPVSSVRGKHPTSTPRPSSLAERPRQILEEWGFTHSHTAVMMLKRAQKMKSKKQQQKKKDPLACQSIFRICSYQMDPAGARSRRAKHLRNDVKAGEIELGLQLAEKTERAKQERAQQWAVHSDRDSESLHFLPEISADVLNGGRVQLVADPGYTERQHHASGLWANSSSAARPCKEDSYPRSNSLGHARKEVLSPKRVSSAPSKKERISFRDNPVQLSGGWGGGKKRDRVHK